MPSWPRASFDGDISRRHGHLADAVNAGELQLGEPARSVERGQRRHGGFGQFGEDGPDGGLAAHQRSEHLTRVVAVPRHHTQAGDGIVVQSLRDAVKSMITLLVALAARSSGASGRSLQPVRPTYPCDGGGR